MSVQTAIERGQCMIKISGRFDFSCHSAFREAIQEAPEGVDMVVDLDEASYLDSAALGMLLLLREQAAKRSVNVSLVNCRGQAKEVLQLANFGRLFRIE